MGVLVGPLVLVNTVSRLPCGQPKLKHLKSQNKTESLQEVEEIKQPGGLGALGSQEPGRQVPVEGATSK